MDLKKYPALGVSQDNHLRPKDTCTLKVKWWRNIGHTYGCQKKAEAEVAIYTSDKLEFKPGTVTRDEEGHYIITKGLSKKMI